MTATGLNGDDKLVSLHLSKPVPFINNSELNLEFDYLDQSTHLTYFSNKTYGGAVAYRIHYDDPTRYSALPWETALFGSWVQSNYASPDPCCSTSGNPAVFSPSTRLDNHWRFGVNQIIPITKSVDFVAQFQRDIVSSNLPLYAYTSNSVLGGLKIRF